MIVSASYKTDIPAFYAEWFLNRLEAGRARMVNPWGGQVHTVDLRPGACDGFVFWTKNAGPFMEALAEVEARGFPFVVQYTLTGYPRALETSVVSSGRSVELMRRIAGRYGPRAVVWRYDPVILTSLTPPDWHRRQVEHLARALKGTSDEVVFSFAHVYRKTRRNTDRAAARHGFTWRDPPEAEKRALLGELAEIAAGEGIRPTLCAQPELLEGALFSGLEAARCIDAGRLSDVAGRAIAAPTKGNRPGCFCAEARAIGAYDTCPHGCVYCYAVQRPAIAKHRYRDHDPAAEFLAPPAGQAD